MNALAREPRPAVTDWSPSAARLSHQEREEIRAGLERGDSFTLIAGLIGRAVSTVSREVAANGGRTGYQAWRAHRDAGRRARRPKTPKLASTELAAKVTEWLEEWWSPEEIARRLRIEFPDDPMMWVSHETIYQSLFVQGRGELRRELHRCLRSGRAHRRPHDRLERRGRIPNMVMIRERPAEAPTGQCQATGKATSSSARTAAQRSGPWSSAPPVTSCCCTCPTAGTPHGRRSDATGHHRLPAELCRTVTWDQGKEMASHAAFTVDTGIQVYFCDPHSPWQRGSNENTNGLLRQYMPKGTDLSAHSAEDLDRIARSLNNRPRKTLGFMKPSERLAELLALTA